MTAAMRRTRAIIALAPGCHRLPPRYFSAAESGRARTALFAGFTCTMRSICVQADGRDHRKWEACNTRWHQDAARQAVATVLLGQRRLCMPIEAQTEQEMGTSKKWQTHNAC